MASTAGRGTTWAAIQDPRLPGKHPELKAKVKVPDVLFQPHSAPLGLVFYTGQQFDAEPSRQHLRRVARLVEQGGADRLQGDPRAAQERRGDRRVQDFVTGFVTPDGQVWGRPVGVAVTKDGALMVSDDGSGWIWQVSKSK